MDPAPTVRAVADDALGARIVSRVPMRYAAGADAVHDRPAHVRAASGLAWLGDRLVVIQDDAGFVALVDPETGLAEPLTLPAGTGGARQFDDSRGNKQAKPDLEALVQLPTTEGVLLAAFGSGSMAPREIIVLLSFPGDQAGAVGRAGITLHPARGFYAALRSIPAFAGSDMNIEGAVYSGGAVRLFGRGNGAIVGSLSPLNATADIDWALLRAYLDAPSTAPAPPPRRVTQYDLGSVDGVALGFTDATVSPDGIVLYAAAAEASPDARRDGDVRGSALGVIRGEPAESSRRTTVRDEEGRVFRGKIEGIAVDGADEHRVLAVVDCDDHAAPAELLEIVLSGDWWV
jgi:hypothetical protein